MSNVVEIHNWALRNQLRRERIEAEEKRERRKREAHERLHGILYEPSWSPDGGTAA